MCVYFLYIVFIIFDNVHVDRLLSANVKARHTLESESERYN